MEPPFQCGLGCCSSHFAGVAPGSAVSESSSVGMLPSPVSPRKGGVHQHGTINTTESPVPSAPQAMATVGETKVKSPPKLELGREPPSEEALAAES